MTSRDRPPECFGGYDRIAVGGVGIDSFVTGLRFRY